MARVKSRPKRPGIVGRLFGVDWSIVWSRVCTLVSMIRHLVTTPCVRFLAYLLGTVQDATLPVHDLHLRVQVVSTHPLGGRWGSSPLFRTNFQIEPFDDDIEGLSH